MPTPLRTRVDNRFRLQGAQRVASGHVTQLWSVREQQTPPWVQGNVLLPRCKGSIRLAWSCPLPPALKVGPRGTGAVWPPRGDKHKDKIHHGMVGGIGRKTRVLDGPAWTAHFLSPCYMRKSHCKSGFLTLAVESSRALRLEIDGPQNQIKPHRAVFSPGGCSHLRTFG